MLMVVDFDGCLLLSLIVVDCFMLNVVDGFTAYAVFRGGFGCVF